MSPVEPVGITQQEDHHPYLFLIEEPQRSLFTNITVLPRTQRKTIGDGTLTSLEQGLRSPLVRFWIKIVQLKFLVEGELMLLTVLFTQQAL